MSRKKKTKENPKPKTREEPPNKEAKGIPKEIKGILLMLWAGVSFLSLASFHEYHSEENWLGLTGYVLGHGYLYLLGFGAYALVLLFGWIGWRWLSNQAIEKPKSRFVYALGAILSICLLLDAASTEWPEVAANMSHKVLSDAVRVDKAIPYYATRAYLGGIPLYGMYGGIPDWNLQVLLGRFGTALFASCTLMLFSTLFFQLELTDRLRIFFERLMERREERREKAGFLRFVKLRVSSRASAEEPSEVIQIQPKRLLTERPQIDDGLEKKGDVPFEATWSLPKDERPTIKRPVDFSSEKYKLPPVSLLTTPKRVDKGTLKKDLKNLAEVLEETLLSFGIEAKVGAINCGSTITSLEVHPAIGVKVQRIKALENDIALNPKAKSIRIIAPIPGKAAVGIEIPSSLPQEVGFKDLMQSYQKNGSPFEIPILLGQTVHGLDVASDLAKWPHGIIAGATGSGKSVCINTIVMSILMNARPDQIKLLMIDPKKVELTPYTRLPHMLAPVITEPQGACAALNWLVKEMETRYECLKLVGARNIASFNKRKRNPAFEEACDVEIPDKMPYIVGIIDELADLMMVSSHDIEAPIARIAQMARAVGIHLILATQRPSREVITGLIKANFPTRISFKVASRINSQIILDEIGAETLLGNGDMLFLPPGTSNLVRAQGAYIRDEDIHAVVNHICMQAGPKYLIESFDQMGLEDLAVQAEQEANPRDALYEKALSIVEDAGSASTTFLQRKLKIGYARAASLMDQLEAEGIVGPAEGGKSRPYLGQAKEEKRKAP